ncbi:tetratricopeptide repeat protein [Candidatus Dependentiae bacterium]
MIIRGKSGGVILRFGTEKDYALLDELEKKLKENPDDVDLLIQKGVLYLDASEDDKLAFPPLDRAIHVDPNNVDALFWRAYADYVLLGDPTKERELVEKALALDPNRVDCNYMLSILFSDNNDVGKSIHYLEKALQLEPTWINVRLNLACDLLRCYKFSSARETLLDGLKIYKKFELPKAASRMEWYYEDYVTGRVHYTDWHLKDWLERVKVERKKARVMFLKVVSVLILITCTVISLWQLIKWIIFA